MKQKKSSATKVIPAQETPLFEVENRLPIYKYGAVIGIVSGLAVALLISILFYFTESDALDVRNQLFIEPWICLLCLYIGTEIYKRRRPNTNFHFWQGALLGSIPALFTALVSAAFVYAFCQIEPMVLQRHINDLVYQNETHIKVNFVAQFGTEAYQKMIAEYKAITPNLTATDEFLKKFFPVFILSLLVAMATRRKFVALTA